MKHLLPLFLLFITCTNAFPQQLNPIVDSIPMRDGKKLAADIYLPSQCTQCPTILIQTPYRRLFYRNGLPLGIGLGIDTINYNIVTVDWRGFWGSSAAANPNASRGEDGYDVVEWIPQQAWSDGQVGTWGPSALGKMQYQTAQEQPPSLVCGVPLVAAPQTNYQEYYPGGVLRTEYAEQLDGLGFGVSGLILANPVHNLVWQVTENSTYYPADIEVPMLMIGGWYDHNVELMLDFFEGLQQNSPNNEHKLLMGPWAHGGFGQARVGTCMQGALTYNEACGWSDSLAWVYFDHHLRGQSNGWQNNPEVMYFQMGQNNWEDSPSWPPTGTSDFQHYLHENGLLKNELPASPGGESSFDYDPRDPSPTIGGATLRQDLLQGPYDQAPDVESRNDILVFSSVELGADVVLKGQPVVHLFVSSDRMDTDFAIRLTDVYPDGRSMLLAEGIKRMRFRNGYSASDTSLMVPGQVYEIEIPLPNLANTFLTGHKIRVDITSSNYPRFDSNLNNGDEMYTAGDTLVAHNTVYHNAGQASYIELPLVDFVGSVTKDYFNEPTLQIFPNPGNGKFRFQINSNSNQMAQLKILDLSGRQLYNHHVNDLQSLNQYNIDISELSAGSYVLLLQNVKGETLQREKLVLIK